MQSTDFSIVTRLMTLMCGNRLQNSVNLNFYLYCELFLKSRKILPTLTQPQKKKKIRLADRVCFR
jgi:hypothetical protein